MFNKFQKVFGGSNVRDLNSFDSIRISIASPERIRSWSYGEVKKPETINYRTFKPEKDGLFCSRIFGPVKDYECLCGKYKRMKYKGVICEKCGVEVIQSRVRRERMGHIDLAAPVAHIWYVKSIPSKIALLLDITAKDMKKILYFESYVVIDPGVTLFNKYDLLTEDEYYDALDKYGEDTFTVGTGAEAIRDMLKSLNLEEEMRFVMEKIEEVSSDLIKKRLEKRLKLINDFLHSNSKPEWMILECIPVLPPDLRPLVPLEGGRFASSDLNDLYRRVINRNNRLKRLLELQAPDIIIRNEKRMLQEAVDALFDNGRSGKVLTGGSNRPLKSLSDMLKGKQGRFRQNLLGKRVDYSGRSVVVVGPELKLHECGLPKNMALELFKPFVYSKLERYGIANTLKTAKRMVERETPEVWDILEEVIKEHPVLLNRAPTLHRLGIQAFEPHLIDGKAIQLHPLVCKAFNADFDGDQMAVHVPLSTEAQMEARVLMMSSNNILSPASGKPIIDHRIDMLLGMYYLTMELPKKEGEKIHLFVSDAEIDAALENGDVVLQSRIKYQFKDGKVYDTTVGRTIFGRILPKEVEFSMINKTFAKSALSEMITYVFEHCGQKDTVVFADQIKNLGFKYSTESGVSFGKDDLIVSDKKNKLIADTQKKISEYEKQYEDGLITHGEKYNKVIDAWTNCSDEIGKIMLEEMSKMMADGKPNSVFMMADSGARGSVTQLRQIVGMRGLMARTSGKIIETPIISNFKEGLSVFEYSISTHGSRKGLTDTALKTANSGYLTRRLVDVAQDCVISVHDCGTEDGLNFGDVIEGSDLIATIAERILGRVLAADVVHPKTGEALYTRGTLVDEAIAKAIGDSGVASVKVRSALTCKAERGICAKCYGRDLASKRLISIGESVGIVAAQSVGEPGTQLTLRTFHVGGAAQSGSERSSIESPLPDMYVHFDNCHTEKNTHGVDVVMTKRAELLLSDENGKGKAKYKIPYGSSLFVTEGQKVDRGTRIAEWDPYVIPLITEQSGYVKFVDVIEDVSMHNVIDESTGLSTKVIIDWRQYAKNSDLKPRIVLTDKDGNVIKLKNGQETRIMLSVDTVISVDEGDFVQKGDIVAKMPRESVTTKDITGGLPRVVELFEARKPKDGFVIADADGVIEFAADFKGRKQVYLNASDGSRYEYIVPKNRYLAVQDGDTVRKGDLIVEGATVPHDILRVMGVEALADYFVNEIQSVYRLQGVQINDKHIEIILKQMLRKVEITNPGDTKFLIGEVIDRKIVNQKNSAVDGEKAKYIDVLQGITKASLQTESFISAASFQETTKVLTDVAIKGKVDHLVGLKENLTLGRLIPAGTGLYTMFYKKKALEEDIAFKEAEKNSRLENDDELSVDENVVLQGNQDNAAGDDNSNQHGV